MMNTLASKDMTHVLTDKLLSVMPKQISNKIQTKLPSLRDEAWKYTPLHTWLSPILESDIKEDVSLIKTDAENTLYFSNGKLIKANLSSALQDGIEIEFNLVNTKEEWPAIPYKGANAFFEELALASAQIGYVIRVKEQAKSAQPLHIIYEWNGKHKVFNTYNQIIVERGASLAIISRHISSDNASGLHNQLTRIWLKPTSVLSYYNMQTVASAFSFVDEIACTVDADACFNAFQVIAGGGLSRNDFRINLKGSGANAILKGLNLLSGAQHADTNVVMIHQSPNCESNQRFKSIVSQQATAVFNGTIHVERNAQKTNAFQSARSILLGDQSRNYVKPRLEIYADDVKCSHGATTGQIDQEALFYLQSRGISLAVARNMLIAAFASDVFEGIENEEFLHEAERLIENFTGVHED